LAKRQPQHQLLTQKQFMICDFLKELFGVEEDGINAGELAASHYN